MKRKYEEDPYSSPQRPIKRLSMLDNTPQQWKEQRRKILKMSKQKLKSIVDVDCNLRVSVLINNTYRKMKRELRENSSPSTWQYTPKPLFPNRSASLMCPPELEWERDDINSKELTPPAADLSIVLSDILGDDDDDDEDNEGGHQDEGEQDGGEVSQQQEVTQSKENCDIMDTSTCNSDSVIEQSDSAINSDITDQDVSDLDSNTDSNNMDQQPTEQDLPINYSMQKKSLDNDEDNHHQNSLSSNQNTEGQSTPTNRLSNKSSNNNTEGHLMVSSKDSSLTSSKQTASTIEDFVIGGRMDWSQNCDKVVNFVYSTSSIGPMLPMFDLTNITSYCNNSGNAASSIANKTADQQQQPATAAVDLPFMDSECSATTTAASNIDCDINNSNNSKVGFHNSKMVNDTCNHQQQQGDSRSLQYKTTSNKENTITDNSEGSSLTSSNNCDIDINQHIWACFQQFNMAIACS